jgi:SAM-dependent methyltransferase
VAWQDYARHPSRIPAKLVRMAQNAVLDLRYGIRASGTVPTPFGREGAFFTVSSQVSALAELFDPARCPIHPSDVLVDVGCGQGRVIAYWLSRRIPNEIVGVEINEQVAADTRARLGSYRNVTIITGNVVDLLPAKGTVFFLYSPFDLRMTRGFRDALARTARDAPQVRIVYYNPTEIAAFEEDDRWDIERLPASPRLLWPAAYIQLKPAAHARDDERPTAGQSTARPS